MMMMMLLSKRGKRRVRSRRRAELAKEVKEKGEAKKEER